MGICHKNHEKSEMQQFCYQCILFIGNFDGLSCFKQDFVLVEMVALLLSLLLVALKKKNCCIRILAN